jgi:hypothetical protein
MHIAPIGLGLTPQICAVVHLAAPHVKLTEPQATPPDELDEPLPELLDELLLELELEDPDELDELPDVLLPPDEDDVLDELPELPEGVGESSDEHPTSKATSAHLPMRNAGSPRRRETRQDACACTFEVFMGRAQLFGLRIAKVKPWIRSMLSGNQKPSRLCDGAGRPDL